MAEGTDPVRRIRWVRFAAAVACAWALIAVDTAAAQSLSERIDKGNSLFADGRKQEALDVYQKASEAYPGSPELAFNMAAAHLSLDELDAAEALLKQVEESHGVSPELAAAAQYNHGLIDIRRADELAKSDPKGAIPIFRQAERHFRNSLAAQPGDPDAAKNIEVVQRKIQSLEDAIKKREEQEKKQQQKQNTKNQPAGGKQQQGDQQQNQQQDGQQGQQQQDQQQQNQQDRQGQQSPADQLNDLAQRQQSAAQQSKSLADQQNQTTDPQAKDMLQKAQDSLAQDQQKLNDQTRQAADNLRKQASQSQDPKQREQMERAAKAAEDAQKPQQQASQDLKQSQPDKASQEQQQAAQQLAKAAQMAEGQPDQKNGEQQAAAQQGEGRPQDSPQKEFNVTAAQILEKEAKDRERIKRLLRLQRGKAAPVDKDW